MEFPVNLANLDSQQFQEFINSFDTVITDCDGVLFGFCGDIIQGVPESLKKLQELKKEVHYLSNNTIYGLDLYHKKLIDAGFICTKEDILYPTLAIIDHLKSINFQKKLFVLGTQAVKESITAAGFQIIDNNVYKVEEKMTNISRLIEHNSEVGAVIVEVDLNLNYTNLAKAATHLQYPDVLFISGVTETKIPIRKKFLLGPGCFCKILEEISGRTAKIFAKPSSNLGDFANKHFKIKDPSRVLFIGDTLYQDIFFAHQCGYKKLLVLTGVTTLEDAENTEENWKPDYYINSLGDLNKLIENNL